MRRLRKAKGLSQRELASQVDKTGAYIAQLETGARKNPSLDVLKAREGARRAGDGAAGVRA
jgi:transcriptional regulator with XRE-family HTH domain